MSNGKKELGRGISPSTYEKGIKKQSKAYDKWAADMIKQYPKKGEDGKAISDADQKFIARMNNAIKDGSKSISDADQTRYKRLTGKNWPGGGRTTSDKGMDKPKATPRQKRMRLGETPMEEIRRTSQEIRYGGSVKKYAKGGGIRKAKYK
jgi:hypothetical protein